MIRYTQLEFPTHISDTFAELTPAAVANINNGFVYSKDVRRIYVVTDGIVVDYIAYYSEATGGGGGGVVDGNKGDITVSGLGSSWQINPGVVSTIELGGNITTAGKNLLDDATPADQRATLQLEIGLDVQAWDQDLEDISILTPGTDDFLVYRFGHWNNETPGSVKTILDLSGVNTGDQNLFSKISVAGQSDVIADSTTDTLNIVAGSNITITTDAATDSITINSTAGSNNSFGVVAVPGQSNVVADSPTDTLNIVAGTNVSITTDPTTDTITINSTGGGGGSVTNPYVRGAGWESSTTGAIDASLCKEVNVTCPVAGTIYRWTILTEGGSGSCVIDIWKTTYSLAPPTMANTITASAKPTISSNVKAQSTTLTGWTTSVAANDVMTFKLQSSSIFTSINIFVEII